MGRWADGGSKASGFEGSGDARDEPDLEAARGLDYQHALHRIKPSAKVAQRTALYSATILSISAILEATSAWRMGRLRSRLWPFILGIGLITVGSSLNWPFLMAFLISTACLRRESFGLLYRPFGYVGSKSTGSCLLTHSLTAGLERIPICAICVVSTETDGGASAGRGARRDSAA
eukprot:6173453-Pleurochrysis_carterae.AAC.5